MDVHLSIKRFNPEADEGSHWDEFVVDLEPTDRVLDALKYVKWYLDGSLTFRSSCAQGICGSDALRINGHNRLACKVLIRDVTQPITIEPIYGLKVLKDLVVDMTPFFAQYRSIMPYLVNNDPAPEKERLQSEEAHQRYDDSTKCILCAACTTSCPSFWANGKYVGPMAIVQAHRFIFDTRDQATEQRLAIMSQPDAVWRCRTIFNCTEACPRGIQITRRIDEVRRAISFGVPKVK
ncbi:MAG TPA: succinate dehydrogenase iron-sulfur subunit [Anaerolineae bacterium]